MELLVWGFAVSGCELFALGREFTDLGFGLSVSGVELPVSVFSVFRFEFLDLSLAFGFRS